MKLYYRGLVCELNPTQIANRKQRKPFQFIPKTGKAYNLNYCGANLLVAPNNIVRKLPVKPIFCRLIYRGLAYWVHHNDEGEAITIASSTNPFLFNNCSNI
ncbi:MAG: hypothetical protein KME01_12660 [Chroococcus sp. CMT-3BRIN-NPC107]|jgi:hypothetical protein|nr:hypothetical protein [Chroococcus sp. CMT-3BRIN-NPC107]